MTELVRRGYTVELASTYEEGRVQQLMKYKARVVITSALYDNACLDYFVYSIAGFCKKVVNLQWEQILTNEDESHPSFYQNPKGYAKEALHLCWGEETRRRLLRAGVSSNKALVVGPVQMDTLRPEFNILYLNKGELAKSFSLDEKKEWVLFISSFSFVNMSNDEYNLIAKAVGNRISDFKDISTLSKIEVVKWLLLAINKFPNKLFIYRPHPSENDDEMLTKISTEHQNFRVIKDLPIKQWIKCCDKFFTWYSTSSAEVFFSNKSCSILRPVPIPYNWEVTTFNNARVISSVGDFLKEVDNNGSVFPLDPDVFSKYYYQAKDNYPSYMKICDVLERVIRTDDFIMKKKWGIFPIYPYLFRMRNHLAFIVKTNLVKTNYRFLFFNIQYVILKLENHISSMDRLKRNKSKNQADASELEDVYSKIERVVNVANSN
jgi:hypothetical protein